MKVSLTVNGETINRDIEPNTLLADFLRDELRLTGTHVGCDTTQCGCCIVHCNGHPIKSCTVFVAQIEGSDVLTIEGLAGSDGQLHPVQEAFRDRHGLQCGFCTPGMVMMGVDIARRFPCADEKTVRRELEGNLCRCTGYQGIVEAIMSASGARIGGH